MEQQTPAVKAAAVEVEVEAGTSATTCREVEVLLLARNRGSPDIVQRVALQLGEGAPSNR